MLRNYIKIALRNLIRNKVYSLINILGLTLGITCSSLLFLLVADELSFDDMYDKKDQTYRIVEIDNSAEKLSHYGITSPPVGRTLKEEFPEVVDFTRLFKFGGHFDFQIGEERYQERSYFAVDKNFFDVFNQEWIEGNPKTALDKVNSIVIDEEWAQKLFGTTIGVLGKELSLPYNETGIITGVIKKVPQNSHIQFKLLTPTPDSDPRFMKAESNWDMFFAYTYVVLANDASLNNLDTKIPDFIDQHFKAESNRNFYLQSVSDIHFNSVDIEYGAEGSKGQITYVFIFSAIGLFILIIACINYMNLATARSLHRGKEIGIRKVSGAVRYQLVLQFLSESILVALIAFVLSIGLIDLLLPFFNDITEKNFVFNSATMKTLFSLLFFITLLVGGLSGSYPALLMSNKKPVNVLKGEKSAGGSLSVRQFLVVTQFVLSIIMIIATIVATKQLNYIQNKSLGFNKNQIIVIDINNGDVREKFETIKSELERSPYISKASVSSRVPGEWKDFRQVYLKSKTIQDSLLTTYIGIDEQMLDVYEIELKEGSNFTGNRMSDSLSIIINEAAVTIWGLIDPVGQSISLNDGGTEMYKIIGVVKDFNFQSLHSKIEPIILGYQSNAFQSIDYFSIKFEPEHIEEVLAHATEIHNSFDHSSQMEYHFLDQQWQNFYKEDRRASNVFSIGAGITIFIACMGLLGLASFTIQKRMKEMSIRKVLGASEIGLFILISKSFILQIVLACLIAFPISWYLVRIWLDNFVFKFELGIMDFLLGGLVAIGIALLSISYNVLKATKLNPANTLKNE